MNAEKVYDITYKLSIELDELIAKYYRGLEKVKKTSLWNLGHVFTCSFFVYLLQIYVKYSIIISQVKEIKMLVNHNIIDNLCEDAGEQRKQKAQKYRDENRILL